MTSKAGPREKSERKLAAIMFTDIVGYTALAQSDEKQALDVLDRHNRLLRPFFSKYHGREVKTIGDAFLVEFDSALDATLCAVEIQKFLHDYNISLGGDFWKINLRIGIHVGDVVKKRNDILGDAVNIASRVRPLAVPEGVCISQQVYDQIHNKIEYRLVPVERSDLKNVRFPTPVYQVVFMREKHAPDRTMPSSISTISLEGSSDRKTIAVLPFSNMSPDPQDAFFADGVTEEIIATISGISALGVISRTSTMAYKGTTKKLGEIGRELGAGSILEGSFRKAGNRIRVTVQLIDVPTDKHLWAQTYDRNLDDVFAIQSEIASSVSEQLKIRLIGAEKEQLNKIPTKNMQAYESYLRGLHFILKGHLDTELDSIRYFEAAIEKDPNFSAAYAALGSAYIQLGGDQIPWKIAAEKASVIISKALEFDNESSDAHVAKGNLSMQVHLDWDLAEREFKRAIDLNPSNAEAHHWFSILLMFKGNLTEATKEARLAVQLNPVGLNASYVLTLSLACTGQFEEALSFVRRLGEFEPSEALPKLFEARLYADVKNYDQAEKAIQTVIQNRLGITSFAETLLARIYLSLGRLHDAEAIVRKIEKRRDFEKYDLVGLAPVYWALGNRERAFEILENAVDEDPIEFFFDFRFPNFSPLKEDPRYRAIVSKLSVPEYQIVEA